MYEREECVYVREECVYVRKECVYVRVECVYVNEEGIIIICVFVCALEFVKFTICKILILLI